MFGNQATMRSVLKELYAELANVESKIEGEQADLIRAKVNVDLHVAQIEFLNKRRASVDAAITKTEREQDERKEGKANSASTPAAGRRHWWQRGHSKDENGVGAHQDRGSAATQNYSAP